MRDSLAYLFAAVMLTAAGCASNQAVRDPEFAAVAPPEQPTLAPEHNTGAIFQPGRTASLFEDIKAHQVGDLLTVNLVEETNAQKAADTEVSREQATDVGNPTIAGQEVQINPLSGLPLTPGNWNLSASLSGTNEFTGSGSSSQSNQLTGTITVTVAKVLANGNLAVRGEKVLTLNRGDEYIQFSGIVRPTDISADNTVASTQVANAKIRYSGKGELANANRMGWLARFFNSIIWPF